jgi:hypothetical protein
MFKKRTYYEIDTKFTNGLIIRFQPVVRYTSGVGKLPSYSLKVKIWDKVNQKEENVFYLEASDFYGEEQQKFEAVVSEMASAEAGALEEIFFKDIARNLMKSSKSGVIEFPTVKLD